MDCLDYLFLCLRRFLHHQSLLSFSSLPLWISHLFIILFTPSLTIHSEGDHVEAWILLLATNERIKWENCEEREEKSIDICCFIVGNFCICNANIRRVVKMKFKNKYIFIAWHFTTRVKVFGHVKESSNRRNTRDIRELFLLKRCVYEQIDGLVKVATNLDHRYDVERIKRRLVPCYW